jgi:chromosome partitioning protein
MAYFITTAKRKGGVGATTTVLNLLKYFLNAGMKSVIVDIDPQGSATKLHQLLGDEAYFDIINRGEFDHFEDLVSMTQGYDVVLIDVPPFFTVGMDDILKITNLAIIPTKASILDFLEIEPVVEYINKAKGDNPALKHVILFTMVKSSSTLVKEMTPDFESYGPVLKNGVPDSTAYVRSIASKPEPKLLIEKVGAEIVQIIMGSGAI